MRWNYVIEGVLLGVFMMVAALVGIWVSPGGSGDASWSPAQKRFAAGCVMGVTSMLLTYSPLGRRSGSHINPAITLAFFFLKKIELRHVGGYISAQFLGATLGVGFAAFLWRSSLSAPGVTYVATLPGMSGAFVAVAAEAAISFILMSVILRAGNSRRFAPYTGVFAGILVAVYITFESPLSGMSMNPARSFGSAFFAMGWASYWIYVFGPCVGMLGAAAVFRASGGRALCAKVSHPSDGVCTFSECDFVRHEAAGAATVAQLIT